MSEGSQDSSTSRHDISDSDRRQNSFTSIASSSQSVMSKISWVDWQKFCVFLFYHSLVAGADNQVKDIIQNMEGVETIPEAYPDPGQEVTDEIIQRLETDRDIPGVLVFLMDIKTDDEVILRSLTRIAHLDSLRDKPKVFLAQNCQQITQRVLYDPKPVACSNSPCDGTIEASQEPAGQCSVQPESQIHVIDSTTPSPMLVDFTSRLHKDMDLMDACQDIMDKYNEKESTATTQSTLTKGLGVEHPTPKLPETFEGAIKKPNSNRCVIL